MTQGLILLQSESRQAEGGSRIAGAEAILTAVPDGARTVPWAQAMRSVRKARLELADLSDKRSDIPAIADAMMTDMARWPAALARSSARDADLAHLTYYRALHAASVPDLARSIALHLDAEKRFDALLTREPGNPGLLDTAAWNALDGFAAASREGREALSNRLIQKAHASINALRAVDSRDRAAAQLSLNIREALAQNYRDQDRFAEAIALQGDVVAERRALALIDSNARTRGNLAFSLTINGIVARDGGARALACDSWREALRLWTAQAAQGDILGFHERFMPGLRRHIKACAAGTSLQLGPMAG